VGAPSTAGATGAPRIAPATTAAPAGVSPRNLTGSAASVAGDARQDARQAIDPILNNPEEAYRTEVKQALMDAMLDHSAPLGVPAAEWLTIAARRNEDRSRLAPVDSDARTIIIRIQGADLAAFRAGRLTREDALKRMDVRVF
jgi:hypothetical protein